MPESNAVRTDHTTGHERIGPSSLARAIIAPVCVLGLAVIVTGCVEPARERVIFAGPEPIRAQATARRISDDGEGWLILPDGTRVELDGRGGFTLPNGDYVRRDASGALNLPNGARCLPTAGGFACP